LLLFRSARWRIQFPSRDAGFVGPINHGDGTAGPYWASATNDAKAEIVRRSDRAKGFVPLPKRWIVERTIAWLNRCRRLAKDWENLNRSALAFIKLASIRLMLRKLCNS
jgi:transposase